jgi:hypothetical protein
MKNPISRSLVDTLMAAMPTPEEADTMGTYDVVINGEVFNYKGESLGSVEGVADSKWLREMTEKMYAGEINI